MRYFIYCRKSQEAEDRQILSLESQADEVAKLALADPSIEVVDTFTDRKAIGTLAVNGGQPDTEEFARDLAWIRGHKSQIMALAPLIDTAALTEKNLAA